MIIARCWSPARSRARARPRSHISSRCRLRATAAEPLVDCDLRNPSVQKLAGRPVQAGLTEYLAGAAKPGQIVTALGKDKPDVIFAGRHAGTADGALGSEAFPRAAEHDERDL